VLEPGGSSLPGSSMNSHGRRRPVTILNVSHLSVRIPTEDGIVHAVQDVSFSVKEKTIFGIVGESGAGKSVLTQAITGLLPYAEVTGRAEFDGRDLLGLSGRELRAVRGARVGMIFQDPLSSLHPYYTIGSQITEMIRTHEKVSAAAARDRAIEILGKVGIPRPAERFSSYPHQFSGGMRQRVMIAIAMVLNPPLIIADEPTTALDVTVQAQIIGLLQEMQREYGTTIVMITHDLGLLSTVADDVMVMYAGNRLEVGANAEIFGSAAHPYTAGLLRSAPSNYSPGTELVPIPGQPPSLLRIAAGCVFADRCPEVMDVCRDQRPPTRRFADGGEAECWLERPASQEQASASSAPSPEPDSRPAQQAGAEPAADVRSVHLRFTTGPVGKRTHVEVLKGIDLQVRKGETLGLVGESGCGKSTLARVIAGLLPPDQGSVRLSGTELSGLTHAQWRRMRKEVQIVFQDPFGSLNPRRRVGAIIGDPLRVHRVESGQPRRRRVQELMELVGLNPEHYNRFPSEFSGGQRQRIGIARALALNPSLVICDEPVSALDVSIQAQILNLLKSLQRELNLTYLFISHDLAVVRHVCDRIAVMSDGQVIELADAETLYAAPQEPFTRTLLSASLAQPFPHGAAHRHVIETVPTEAVLL
jgi:peptide/nickel transport system ATP-binding protein